MVVGALNNKYPMRHKSGTITELAAPIFVINGAANGISPSLPERIAGHVTKFGSDRAALWTNGLYTDLHPLLDASYSTAEDVNDSGFVAGHADGRGFRLNTATQQVEALLLPGEDVSFPRAINSSGHVAGWTGSARAFLYDDAMHPMPIPGAVDQGQIDVNDKDVIVGCYLTGDHDLHAFTYDFLSKTFTDIHDAAFFSSAAASINNDGVVVGSCVDDFGPYAMIWTEANGMRRLIDLVDLQSGWAFSGATGVNDDGEITGHGVHNGQVRAFLLTPMPEGSKAPGEDLVGMVKEVMFAGGGMGILLPSGHIIYPKDGPVDPDSPLQRVDAARSDAAVGLAMQMLATRISDRATRRIAHRYARAITRRAAASARWVRSSSGRSNWLSRLVSDIADKLRAVTQRSPH